MFLVDTNVISERRKGPRSDPGVVSFLDRTDSELFLPIQVIGELRRGVEILRLRGDLPQAVRLETWLHSILEEYQRRILMFDMQCALTWGVLTAVNDQHAVDKQIAAIALVYDLTVVTRNTTDFAGTGVRLINPFVSDVASDLSSN
jgi:predicted nucleic acid-binding protein